MGNLFNKDTSLVNDYTGCGLSLIERYMYIQCNPN